MKYLWLFTLYYTSNYHVAYDSELIRTIWPVVGYLADSKHVEILLFVVLNSLNFYWAQSTWLPIWGWLFGGKKKKKGHRDLNHSSNWSNGEKKNHKPKLLIFFFFFPYKKLGKRDSNPCLSNKKTTQHAWITRINYYYYYYFKFRNTSFSHLIK